MSYVPNSTTPVLTIGTGYSEGSLVDPMVFPVPSYDSLAQTTSTLVNSGRTSSGKIVGQRIGKRNLSKIEMKWSVLPADIWSAMCLKVKGAYANHGFIVYVRYFDMEANIFKIRAMYAGDRSAHPLFVDETTGVVTMWKDCSMNLIDAGYDMSEVNA